MIILSHIRIAEDANKAEAKAQKPAAKKARKEEEPQQLTQNVEKTTLGDLGALQALKEQLQKEDKK